MFFWLAENGISCAVWVFCTVVQLYYELNRGGITARVGCRGESEVGLVWLVLDVGFCAPEGEHLGFQAVSRRKGLYIKGFVLGSHIGVGGLYWGLTLGSPIGVGGICIGVPYWGGLGMGKGQG